MPAVKYFRLTEDVSPLPDHILVYNMEQGDKLTHSGIIIPDDNGENSGIKPRWCQVYKTGKNVDYVKPGEWLLMEHGRWTYGVPVELTSDGETVEHYIQRIDVDAILLVADQPY